MTFDEFKELTAAALAFVPEADASAKVALVTAIIQQHHVLMPSDLALRNPNPPMARGGYESLISLRGPAGTAGTAPRIHGSND